MRHSACCSRCVDRKLIGNCLPEFRRRAAFDVRSMRAMSQLPPSATMYRAFERKDSSYEGVFWLGVRTTGIFCRPDVPRAHAEARERRVLRRALRGAARGLPAVHEMPAAGSRPQAAAAGGAAARRGRARAGPALPRCGARRHGHRPVHRAAAVQALLRHDVPGLSPRAAHGPRTCSTSGKERPCSTHSSTRASNPAADFAKPSRASSARRRRARATSACCTRSGSRRRSAPCSRSPTIAGCICSTSSTGAASSARSHRCRSGCARARCPASTATSTQIERELGEYFAGARRAFDTPVALTGSTFRSRVWKALLAIPPGATCSYAELARAHRPAAGGARGRPRQRRQPAVDHRALPPRDRRRRRADGLRRRAREEAEAPRPRARRPSAVHVPPRVWRCCVILAALWGGSFVFMRVAVPALGADSARVCRACRLRRSSLLALAFAQRRIPPFRTRWREFRGRRRRQLRDAVRAVLLRRAVRSARRPAAVLNATSPFFAVIAGAVWLAQAADEDEARGNGTRARRRRGARGLAAGARRAATSLLADRRMPRRRDVLRARGRIHEARAGGGAELRDRLREPGVRGARADAGASIRYGSGAADGARRRQRRRARDRIHGDRLPDLFQADRRRRAAARVDGDVPHSAVRRAVGRAVPRRAADVEHARGRRARRGRHHRHLRAKRAGFRTRVCDCSRMYCGR